MTDSLLLLETCIKDEVEMEPVVINKSWIIVQGMYGVVKMESWSKHLVWKTCMGSKNRVTNEWLVCTSNVRGSNNEVMVYCTGCVLGSNIGIMK